MTEMKFKEGDKVKIATNSLGAPPSVENLFGWIGARDSRDNTYYVKEAKEDLIGHWYDESDLKAAEEPEKTPEPTCKFVVGDNVKIVGDSFRNAVSMTGQKGVVIDTDTENDAYYVMTGFGSKGTHWYGEGELEFDSSDTVFRPHHYARFNIEPITFITANKLDFLTGNVIKYVLRHDAKNGLEDLRKAARYLEIMIEDAERRERGEVIKVETV